MPDKKNIQLRSEVVNEILSEPPNWMIRWGITVIFFCILSLLLMSWLVKYPDIVKGPVKITTSTPPLITSARTSGKILELHAKENAEVNKNQPIVEIESVITQKGISYLIDIVPDVKDFIQKDNKKINFPDDHYTFGAIQGTYNDLKRYCMQYSDWINDSTKFKRSQLLESKIETYSNLTKAYEKKYVIAKKGLTNTKSNFQKEKKLFQKGLISQSQFNVEENQLFDKQSAVKNIEISQKQTQLALSEVEEEYIQYIRNIKNDRLSYVRNIRLKVEEIQNFIKEWKQNYLLKSPIGGKVSYLSNLSQNQFVNNGDKLFAIIPDNKNYVGTMRVPANGFGKVEVGNKVMIKLKSYPYQQYGQLQGKVAGISPIQQEDMYRIEINFEQKLVTTFNKKIEYNPEMEGIGSIITQDHRLLNRIIFKVRNTLSR